MNLPLIGDGINHMWDIRLVIDMFLGGAAAGAFVLAVVASFSFGWASTASLRKAAGIFSPLAMAIGLAALASELSQPGRSYLSFTSFQFTSLLFWGSWIQLAFLGFAAIFGIMALGWLKAGDGAVKTVGVIGAALGIAVAVYHGLYLADFGRSIWAAGGIPLLLPISALATGAAALTLWLAATGNKDSYIRSLVKAMLWSSIAMLIGAAAYLFGLSNAGTTGGEGASVLFENFATMMWIGIFAVGVLGTLLAFLGINRVQPGGGSGSLAMPAIGALLILTAGFVLRYVVIMGGQLLPSLPIT